MYATFDHKGYDLKNIKTFDTDDGYAFSATLYLNGKRIGNVQNSGTGGPNSYHFFSKSKDPKAFREAYNKGMSALKKAAQETEQSDWVEVEDIFIEKLLNDIENGRRFKRLCKTKTLLRFKGDDEGSYRSVKVAFSPEVKAKLEAVYKEKGWEVVEWLNEAFIK